MIDAPVVLLTNVALEHTDVLGETREEIAAEKLAVARPGATVVLPDAEFAALVARARGADRRMRATLPRPSSGGRSTSLPRRRCPGRLEIRGDEVRDGAHTPAAVDWLLERLPEPGDYVVVASILRDKDADGILERLARAGRILVATRSSNDRSLAADEVAARARNWFPTVEIAEDPREALRLARALGEARSVTGSLYLLADLTADE